MKIIEVTPFFLPSEGGTQRVALNLAREYVAMGHQVSVLTYNAYANTEKGLICTALLKRTENYEGIRILRFKYSTFSNIRLSFSIPLSLRLLKMLLEQKGDLVHYHGFFYLPNVILVIFACKIARKPVLLTTHGLHEAIFDYSISNNIFLKLFAFASMKIVLKNVNAIVALSSADSTALTRLRLSTEKIHCIPNGVDIRKFQDHIYNDGLRRKYSIPCYGPLILCVCRISKNKGLEYLLRAGSKLAQKIGYINILIIGPSVDKQYKADLLKLANNLGISSNTHFKEGVPDEDLVSFYKKANLFVLPSEHETLPLVILEAMAAGCPLIATRVGGIPDIVADGKTGFLVTPRSEDELFEKMLLVLSDENLRNRIQKDQAKFIVDYSWEKIAKRMIKIYQSLF
jgi:glycosyltransferase involved in cell wall biosynthesis